jgi:DNA-directed RNA polymerase subunit alpha
VDSERAKLLATIAATLVNGDLASSQEGWRYFKNGSILQDVALDDAELLLEEAERRSAGLADSVLKTPILNLGLPCTIETRVEHCLSRIGVTTVGDLVNKTESELREVRNLGEFSITVLKRRLADLGLAMKR